MTSNTSRRYECRPTLAALAISVTGMTPQVATPSATVTVSGTLANRTGSAISGITVQAQTSTVLFNARAEMTSFAASGSYPYLIQPAGTPEVTGTVPSGATVRWSVSFPAATFYGQSGVFPLQVQATARGGYTAAARTFLPYWPAGSSGTQPQPLQVAWIWPLVDTPQQGACSQHARDKPACRLRGLGRPPVHAARRGRDLGAGRPAHLGRRPRAALRRVGDDAPVLHGRQRTVHRPVRPEGEPGGQRVAGEAGDRTAGEPAFLTPYANVDVAALIHAGLDASVRTAYQLGDTVAGQVLPHTFGANGSGTGDGAVLKAAWPADGLADAEVLTSLASDAGISTVIAAQRPAAILDPRVRQRARPDDERHRDVDARAARRLGDHQPARLGVASRDRRPASSPSSRTSSRRPR